MPRAITRGNKRIARHVRTRKNLRGIPDRPRLNVFRSLQHIYAQVIDDTTGRTLAAASSLKVSRAGYSEGGVKTPLAKLVGMEIAQRAKAAGVSRVAFDRGGYKYHGRVKALAEAAREGGLEF